MTVRLQEIILLPGGFYITKRRAGDKVNGTSGRAVRNDRFFYDGRYAENEKESSKGDHRAFVCSYVFSNVADMRVYAMEDGAGQEAQMQESVSGNDDTGEGQEEPGENAQEPADGGMEPEAGNTEQRQAEVSERKHR